MAEEPTALQRRAREVLQRLKEFTFHLNFYRIHLIYFILVIFIASVILYGTNTSYHLAYVDALFLCTSAMCNVGLNTVSLSLLSGFQQSVIFVLMLMGDLTVVTISVVYVRRWYFSRKMQDFVRVSKAGKRVAEDVEAEDSGSMWDWRQGGSSSKDEERQDVRQRNLGALPKPSQKVMGHRASHHEIGYGGFPAPWNVSSIMKLFRAVPNGARGDRHKPEKHHYLSFTPSLDHRGRFGTLTPAQEAELGGVEYRALRVLSWLLPLYVLFWLGLGWVILAPYAMHGLTASTIRGANPDSLNPAWWAVFATVAAHTNSGLNLLDANMEPLSDDYTILIFTGALIMAGNTFYPIFLRLTIWTMQKLVPKHSELHHSLAFLMHHPRRCYLLLFPSRNTWFLVAIQSGLTIISWILWTVLNIGVSKIDPQIPGGQRTMDGLFQSVSLRSCGFYTVNISYLAPALQFFYMVTMYISAFPLIMSIRQSNVYEERSLGQTDESKGASSGHSSHGSSGGSGLGVHIRKQLAYDIWWLLLAIFLICIIERGLLETGSNVFDVIFEVVSAYGTVGLSLGVSWDEFSFCGAWSKLSKVIMLSVMLRGRHRILPMAIDRAVLLPGQELMERLDRSYHASGEEWWNLERRVREDEIGEQAEDGSGGGKQDPEEDISEDRGNGGQVGDS